MLIISRARAAQAGALRWALALCMLGLALAPVGAALAQSDVSVEIRVNPVPAIANAPTSVLAILHDSSGRFVPGAVQLNAQSLDGGQSLSQALNQASGVAGIGNLPAYSGQIYFPAPGRWQLWVTLNTPDPLGVTQIDVYPGFTPPPAAPITPAAPAPAAPAAPAVPGGVSLFIATDRPNAPYAPGETITVSFNVFPTMVVRVTDTDPAGNRVVVYDPGQLQATGNFSGQAGTPGTHTLTLEGFLNGQSVGTTATTYTVVGAPAVVPGAPTVPASLGIAVDRAPAGAVYRIGEPIVVMYQVAPAAAIRVTDINQYGEAVVIYQPGGPVGPGSFTGAASTAIGPHTLLLEVLVNGQPVATTSTSYTVLPYGA